MGTLIAFIIFALEIYSFILLARVLLTWFPEIDRANPIVKFLFDITEPVLMPIREMLSQMMPQTGMMIDFSPLVVFLIIRVLVILLNNL